MSQRISNRDKILKAAKELFYSVGYQATSVDDILCESGVAKSNFYYHFPTKEALAVVVLDARIAEYEDLFIQSLRNSALPPTLRLTRFFEQICHVQNRIQMGGCPFGNLIASLPADRGDATEEKFRVRLCELFRNMEEAMCACLTDGAEQGAFRTDISAQDMAAFLVASVQGLLIMTKAHHDIHALIRGLAVARRLLSMA